MKEYNSKDLKLIAKGGVGAIYRLNEELVIKVYSQDTTLEEIEKIKASIKTLVSKGVPSMISFDIVKVDGSLGIVFELLSDKMVSEAIMENDTTLEEYGVKMGKLLKLIHTIEVDDCLPSFKERILSWVKNLEDRQYLSKSCVKTMRRIVDDIPDKKTMIHSDFHEGNVKVLNGELILIDLDEIAYGNPIYDLGFHSLNHVGAGLFKMVAMKSVGMYPKYCRKIKKIEIKEYLKDNDIPNFKSKMLVLALMLVSLTPARFDSGYVEIKTFKIFLKLLCYIFNIVATIILFFKPNLFKEAR